MPVPHISGAFGDLLDPRFQEIFNSEQQYYELQSMLPKLYNMVPTNGRNNMTWSDVGTLPNWEEFTGAVPYQSQAQGFDTTLTPIEFASGIQVERKLFDDDQFHVMDEKPAALTSSYYRTREEHAARQLNNAFSVDTYFYNNTEGVSLCSNSHITNSGASTATGFDNLITASMTATAVVAARIQMADFRGDQGERMSIIPDEMWFPIALCEQAYEIVASTGKLDTANNNVNYVKGKLNLQPMEWNYLIDTNNWFLMDSRLRNRSLFWTDRVPLEFAMVEDFDKFIAKWRGYARYGNAWRNWRFVIGAQVS